MSSDPQWKSFQPSAMDSDTSILDCKSLASVMPSHGSSNGTSYNSGNHYSYPLHHHKDVSNNMYSNRHHDGSYYSYNAHSNSWGGGGSGGGGSGGGGGGGGGSSGGGSSTSNNSGNNQGSSGATFSIGTFTGREGTESFNGESSPSTNSSYNPSHSNNADGSFQRETGIIEKLLHSYGFIQCCERQARLFFHFSQFNGNIEHLKIGDPVEFEMTYDRRTGKPIASFVTKIAPEVVLSEERVTGNVTTEIRADGSGENQGRISYENRGECFFLPYNKEDVEGNVTLRSGDKVSFQIAANQRGNLGASHVRLENAVHPVKYQGVVCTMKESFGFIERADIVKEIFFHFSESKEKRELQLGDDVEFTIQTRNGKEVACGITLLNPGSVIFEDVCDEMLRGQVLKPLERGQQARHQNDPLPGRIKYRAADHSEVEVPFGEKDQKGDFTLKHGDWVEFHLATDRRDGLKRATRISLLDDSFRVSGERREQGMVSVVKDCFGFIRCVEREQELFFRFHEILDVDREAVPGDEVEFTMVPDSTSSFAQNRQNAIRIKFLPPNTVRFEVITKEKVSGVVSADVVNYSQRSPTKGQANGKVESGQITYSSGETKKTINFYAKDCDSKNMPKIGDKVEFDVAQVKSNKKTVALNVRVKQRAPDNEVQHNGKGHRDVPIHQGFIAALKDGFGFIENMTHDKEVFFHFSTLDGDANKLALGLEVEYNLGGRGNTGSCMSAENVRFLPRGTIKLPEVQPDVFNGKVVRPLRSVNPDQDQYAGIVEANTDTDGEKGEQYEFGITSLANKKELLQVGDPVTFQVDAEGRAANISAIRKKRRATVDSVKGQFGFLSYEVEEGKKLFFHTSEVKDGAQLQAGDTVEFVLVTNHRNGKSSACNLTKVSENIQRPERLISRLRTISVDDSGPKLTVTRQPKGPDSTKGFSLVYRQPRQAGVLLE